MQALGMMSGTSLDGIDLAVLETDGEQQLVPGPHGFFAYADEDRQILREALSVGVSLPLAVLQQAERWPAILHTAERLITQRHIQAATAFQAQHHLSLSLIAMHGQTISHRPDDGFTLQIGDAAALAAETGIDVMADFRQADMRAGGQGAPLVPLFHAALIGDIVAPVAVLNMGGVANITWMDGQGDILAFDTGPANALIDDWMMRTRQLAYDADGAWAAQGQVHEAALAAYMADAYFTQKPPKSLDRLHFSLDGLNALSPPLSSQDGAATLTAFTAASIVAGLAQCPNPPERLILCGGGRHNKTLVAALGSHLGSDCELMMSEALGWQGDALEAQAFAWLGVRALKDLPLSLPSSTGARHPVSGGVLFETGA